MTLCNDTVQQIQTSLKSAAHQRQINVGSVLVRGGVVVVVAGGSQERYVSRVGGLFGRHSSSRKSHADGLVVVVAGGSQERYV